MQQHKERDTDILQITQMAKMNMDTLKSILKSRYQYSDGQVAQLKVGRSHRQQLIAEIREVQGPRRLVLEDQWIIESLALDDELPYLVHGIGRQQVLAEVGVANDAPPMQSMANEAPVGTADLGRDREIMDVTSDRDEDTMAEENESKQQTMEFVPTETPENPPQTPTPLTVPSIEVPIVDLVTPPRPKSPQSARDSE